MWSTVTGYAQNAIVYPPAGASLQNSINALPAAGGTVELSPGTYPVSTRISLKSNVAIRGPHTAILAPTGNVSAFGNTGSISNVEFDGFTLRTSGIALHNADHIVVKNVRFENTGSTAVSIGDTASNIQIINNVCENPATYFCFSVGGNTNAPIAGNHDVTISGNTMVNCASDCILVTSTSRVVISNNIVNLCGDTCIESGTGVQNVSITGNVVDISASTSDNIVGISTRSNQYAVVSGNSVIGNPASSGRQSCFAAWHGSYPGETLLEQYVTYVGNQSSGCAIGLKTFQANHFTIAGNDFQNNAVPVSVDTSAGGANEWVELPSRGDPAVVWPTAGRVNCGTTKAGPNATNISPGRTWGGSLLINVANGSTDLGVAAIGSRSCARAVTAPASGVSTSDAIEWAFNAAPGMGYTSGLHVLAYLTTGEVHFLVCNPTAVSLTPSASTITWHVIR